MTAIDDIGSKGAECDIDPQVDSWKASMDRLEAVGRENRANHREMRAILLAIAEHWGVTIKERDSGNPSG